MSDMSHDLGLELHGSIAMLERSVRELVDATQSQAVARTEDVDLTVNNPAPANREARAVADAAVQVDNPYAVMIELRASGDGGGEVIMRIPPGQSRVISKHVRELSLRALGAPAGAIPATVTRYDRPVPPGVYPYSGAMGGTFRASSPGLTEGQRGDLQLGARGDLKVQLMLADVGFPIGTQNAIQDGNGGGQSLDVVPFLQYYNGANWDRARTPNVFKAIGGLAIIAGTPQAIWTPAAGKKYRLMGWVLSCDASDALRFLEGGAERFRTGKQPVATEHVSPASLGNGLLANAANAPLQLDTLVNDSVHGFVFGTEE